ncbi:lytic murein transglycosylase [Suttonella sp. R2A3]|uniref:lytic murein transglycosylase n=1 Tax=Suttonella sp. R2A3 TaxID=2908648 RepID=UPI001F359115|nr:lytic murein transglycosylase [Suttonella sp. R2A3]UJF23848.1 lytic murein transglycosylase [Suttonella sp. R2A3]
MPSIWALLLPFCLISTGCVRVNTYTLPDPKDDVAVEAQEYRNFDAWLGAFRARALAEGVPPLVIETLSQQMHYQPSIAKLDQKQPEFSKMIWSYLDSAVSDARVNQGRKCAAEQSALLQRLGQEYGVPAEVIVAIWGLETSYGVDTGNTELFPALATLAYQGRRRAFAENQLIALMKLMNAGDVTQNPVHGSWAGGMGQTQFIPTTYARYAVDGNYDGRRDLWSTADALASTANYLSASGWQQGVPWGCEVALPANISDNYVEQTMSMAQWNALGVSCITQSVPANANMSLWLPGGRNGPALLRSDNFEVIKVYNNASSYALAVGLLSDAIAGKPALQGQWPREYGALATTQVRTIQQRLSELGFDPGAVDGILGGNTRKAFREWQRSQGVFADGFISQHSAQGLLIP